MNKMVLAAVLSLFLGLFTAIGIWIALRLLYAMTIAYFPSNKEKKVKKAVNKGHVATAYLIRPVIRAEVTKDEISSDCKFSFEYHYKVGEKVYTYIKSSISADDRPATLTLYYIDNPKKAYTYDEMGRMDKRTKRRLFLPSYIIGVIITFIFIATSPNL